MERNKAYQEAELKIESARQSGANALDLSGRYEQNAPKLTELPSALGQLTQLESLVLSRNQLTTLPELLGKLTQLRSLELSENQVTVLPDWLGQFTQLQSLDLSYNQLTHLPDSMSQLTGLESLDLSGNRLTRLPEWMRQFTRLQSLDLRSALLTPLPRWFGELSQLQSLNLGENQLKVLPDWLSKLAQLTSLALFKNRLTALPEWLGHLTHLQMLDLSENQLTALPDQLALPTQLQVLNLSRNQLTALPDKLGELTQLQKLYLYGNQLTSLPESLSSLINVKTLALGDSSLGGNSFGTFPSAIRGMSLLRELYASRCNFHLIPDWIGELTHLVVIWWVGNETKDLPATLAQLEHLRTVNLQDNPLSPELAAAVSEGFDAVKRYVRAKADSQVALNEAKLILIGEGEVGKSCLLSALRDDPWIEGNPTTHGIEIKSVNVIDPDSRKAITLNGWDFGGQRVYRPTHQLFFSAPAIYLVVWKPREGPQQGFVKEWITLVKHRAPEAKILIVATHGGPKQRQPDIDRQELWDLFGKDMVLDFFLVESKPDKRTKKRKGINQLKKAIARAAASLPEVGRTVPKRWEEVRQALKKTSAAYLPLDQVLMICQGHKMDVDESKDFVRISHRLGHLIHYEHDTLLQDIVVLKPDWLSTAISFVLDDEQTRKAHGLVGVERLSKLWDDPKRPKDRYPTKFHSIFLRLMERYDLSYRIAEHAQNGAAGTSLIAQLVPDVRPPEAELKAVWPPSLTRGDEQQVQICRIVDARSGQSATAEGLFFQLIVRLHKYSLGRVNYDESVHWQRGLVLDDDYNGCALLENVGNDVRISVRAAYPERFLSVLVYEVKWLVENRWKGLRCEVTVPCVAPCGKGEPGTGLFEVEKLITFKRQGMEQFPCFVSGCDQAQDISGLLRNAPAARRATIEVFLTDHFDKMKSILDAVREQLAQQGMRAQNNFRILDQNDRRILSQFDDAYTGLMRALTDEAKDGPRLFSFEPIDRQAFDRPKWISAKFRLTLWCEHSRLPLPALNGNDDKNGIYELIVPREWVVKATPYLKLITGVLSLVVPVAASATKLELDDETYKGIAKQLEFGQKGLESALKGSERAEAWASEGDAPDLEHGNAIRGQGAVLRQLHAWLKEKDPSFGGLVRVQNRRQEFLWVHPKFEAEY